ncbi:hemerythrin domain-containing protein [Kaistia dalseonensis]|uniref:Hemerythrin-like domain-containing protein n=1 Tax=Kaistia dalseonensis TaxID=410840 RepID=A0ABU0HDK1_9HYPH|nr:hemerythrin domain-containing protein [Kaistia dalseonensis]MCX5497179.1 hemerythrin domain-containing protein [Kaistia dalseonensis]MDQ0439810.1 hypothetical protein [Kaistia dalseonensis]
MSPPIPDFYGPIHKAIRLALGDFLILLGSSDAADRAHWTRVEVEWSRIEALLEAHSHHEDVHVHPMIHVAAPEVAHTLDAQHETLDSSIHALAETVSELKALDGADDRRRAARSLYLRYSTFMAAYFHHLIEEEMRAMPALVEHFPPSALLDAHRALVGSISPEDKLADLPIIARALAPHERIGLMLATRDNAPPAFFADACRIMQQAIGRDAFEPVAAALKRQAA